MNKLLTLLIVIFVIFGCGENFTTKNPTNSTEQGESNTGDNTGTEIVDDVIDISIKSCVNTFDEENNPIKSCEQEITELTLDLTDKVSAEIQGDAKPQNAANRLVYYSVEPSSLASIDSNGNVTAKNTGKGTITVQSDSNPEIIKSIPLTITNSAAEKGETTPVQAIGFEETNLILQMGEKYQLTPKFTPVNTTERDFECGAGNLANYVDIDKDTCEITGKKVTDYDGFVEIKNRENKTGSVSIKVVERKIPLISFSLPSSISLNKGEISNVNNILPVTYNPSNTNETGFSYVSSDTSILAFRPNSTSLIEPKELGTAVLTVTSKFHPEMFEEVIVNVKDPNDIEPPVHNDINPSDMATHSDRMYIKIMFDVISSTGDIKNRDTSDRCATKW